MSSIVFSIIFPVAGCVISSIKGCINIFLVRLCRRTGKLGYVDPFPWSVNLVTNVSWFIYGGLITDYYLLVSGVTGFVVNVFACVSLTSTSKLC